ncbi:regulatory protein RecX [Nonomuraea longicatena]
MGVGGSPGKGVGGLGVAAESQEGSGESSAAEWKYTWAEEPVREGRRSRRTKRGPRPADGGADAGFGSDGFGPKDKGQGIYGGRGKDFEPGEGVLSGGREDSGPGARGLGRRKAGSGLEAGDLGSGDRGFEAGSGSDSRSDFGAGTDGEEFGGGEASEPSRGVLGGGGGFGLGEEEEGPDGRRKGAGRGKRGRKGGRGRGRSGWSADGPDEDAPAGSGPPADPAAVARNICLRLLTMAPKTRAQLAAAMKKREVPEEVADAVLDRFTELGLINDEAFAEAWVDSRHHGRGLARRALAAELRHRGVDGETVNEAVERLDSDQEAEMARQLVDRKLRSTRGLDPQVRTRRLAGLLARKGYSGGVAFRVIREALEQEGVDLDEDFG